MSRVQGSNLRGALIAAASVAGIVFALTQLTGGDADESIGETVYTAFALVIFTVLGAVGAALTSSRPRLALLGLATVLLAVLAFGSLAISIWENGVFALGLGGGGSRSKVEGATVLLAITTSAASALLLMAPRDDDGSTVLVTLAGVGSLAALTVLGILAIVDVEISGRVYAIFSIVYVLAAMLLMLFRLVPSDRRAEPNRS